MDLNYPPGYNPAERATENPEEHGILWGGSTQDSKRSAVGHSEDLILTDLDSIDYIITTPLYFGGAHTNVR